MRADHATSFACGAALGFALDLAVGDPLRGHPVAVFGRAAAAVERRLWHDHRGWGALHTLVCAGGATAGAALLTHAVRRPARATTPGRYPVGRALAPTVRALAGAATPATVRTLAHAMAPTAHAPAATVGTLAGAITPTVGALAGAAAPAAVRTLTHATTSTAQALASLI
ncbi:cobalamin biosynthesis protein, partial [Streptomyces palmae]|uniref:cobalamin biosynthesis protein n=1 Tax=Streptomyces palmae TaxID=1701085 RepID=UPI003158699E